MVTSIEGPYGPEEIVPRWFIPRLKNAFADIHNERKPTALVPGLDDAFVARKTRGEAERFLRHLLEIARQTYPDFAFHGSVALNRLPDGGECWLPEIRMSRRDQGGAQ